MTLGAWRRTGRKRSRQVVIQVREDNAKLGGCVIESTKQGITLMGRSLDGSANDEKVFVSDAEIRSIDEEGPCKD